MTTESLKTTVLTELGNIAPELDGEVVDPDADLREEFDIDSMDFLNFVIALHKRLDVDIPESDYAKLNSINAVVTYLEAAAAG